jgi:hypothetical protein
MNLIRSLDSDRISSGGTSLGRDSGDAESASKSNRSKTVRPKRKYRAGDAVWRRRPKTSVVS